ncbi:MAG TPA: UPF0182 family protein [Vicinamibacterales bacterium]|nr:UPF0182 family protein [Vicinamibacterales bacterium]
MPTIDWPPQHRPRRFGRFILIALVALLFLSAGTTLSYYVDALWFGTLGFSDVFWRTLDLQAVTFLAFSAATFIILYAAFLLLKPERLELTSGPILINGQPLRLPVEPVLRLIGLGGSAVIAVLTGLGMMSDWSVFALYWYGGSSAAGAATLDPVFNRPLSFYFFTLPAWGLLAGWFTTLAVVVCGAAVFFAVVTGGTRALAARKTAGETPALRGVSATFSLVLLAFAAQVYIGRFDRLFEDHDIFAGVSYTDAHVTIAGLTIVAIALVIGAAVAAINAVQAPKLRWLIAAATPAAVCYVAMGLVGWYVDSFIVKPNQLTKETPFIARNIEATRDAYALNRITQEAFPADTSLEAVDAPHNQETLQNIRLWDWRALQDTLRQIQEIRTYYDFPDIDIDRYKIDGTVREMMLAARELNVDRLPQSSRNWINDKLIYTHGYGITMNPVNGFTPEGLPALTLGNMPVQSTTPDINLKRPEIYFGQLTNADVYVKTRQKEFNYPQGETNNLTSYEGAGGIPIGGFLRRMLIALDRGDISKLPFSDDVTPDSRLLMRRNIRERIQTLAPFLTLDPDPYVVVDNGRLFWMMDGFTTSDTYPYARSYRLDADTVNYMRNSVKIVVDAYDGSVTFYVFDDADPIIAAYRSLFPSLFKNRSEMPASLQKHVRYPELMLKLQAAVYGLYHMTDPEVFYNREDLWTVASEVGMNEQREQAQQMMEPNFVLMKLPGEQATEFVEILPFTPSNRNNLIGWIAGRSDDAHYGTAVVYDFPKTKLVDGPLQIEARIDQNAQLSGQLSLWNQQGSHVRRGNLIVIPVGHALLYAEAIYLQAERSPMPELRIVVLALQDRLVYGSTFESAMASLFGGAPSTLNSAPVSSPSAPAPPAANARPGAAPAPPSSVDTTSLINDAARDLADYEHLTADGKLGEAGQKLESLKQKLDELQRRK